MFKFSKVFVLLSIGCLLAVSVLIYLSIETNRSPLPRSDAGAMAQSEKQKIASEMLAQLREYDEYFKTHSLDDLADGLDNASYANDEVLQCVYNTSRLLESYVGLTGVYRNAISEEDYVACLNTSCDWLFSDRVRYGYTESGAKIIAILPVESNATSLWFDTMNRIRGDENERDILSNYGTIIDIYVEDLTGKANEYEISVSIEGAAVNSACDTVSDDVEWGAATDIPDAVQSALREYGREISAEPRIKSGTWKLFLVDKGSFNLFWTENVEVTLDGEVVTLRASA